MPLATCRRGDGGGGEGAGGERAYRWWKEGVLKTELPGSWPYPGSSGPPLAERVGRTLRTGVFHVGIPESPTRIPAPGGSRVGAERPRAAEPEGAPRGERYR